LDFLLKTLRKTTICFTLYKCHFNEKIQMKFKHDLFRREIRISLLKQCYGLHKLRQNRAVNSLNKPRQRCILRET